jgi:ferritin-like metal-binding protein YciE
MAAKSKSRTTSRKSARGSSRAKTTAARKSSSARPRARARAKPRRKSPGLEELLVIELQEIHNAETQLARLIPRLVKAADSDELRSAIEQRLEEGEQILADVEQGLSELGASPGRKKNVAAEGLVNDLRDHVQELQQGPALDTVLIGGLQKTEHYCIAAWGTVKSLGAAAGQEDLIESMQRALDEGKRYDEQLTELAEQKITPILVPGQVESEGTAGFEYVEALDTGADVEAIDDEDTRGARDVVPVETIEEDAEDKQEQMDIRGRGPSRGMGRRR